MQDWEPLARHTGRVAMSFSGGKDSTIILWMLRHAGLLDRVTVYHLDTGDLFPEMREHVAALSEWCPHWVTVRSNARAWAARHGEPSDLVPYTSHAIGQAIGADSRISARFDCCYANLMQPIYERIKADGMTLIIRGTRADDMRRLPVSSGDVVDGLELFLPLQSWTGADVFAFAERNGVPLPTVYQHFKQSPECATCPAWWSEGRGPYLKAHHPALFEEYRARMAVVVSHVAPAIGELNAAIGDLANSTLSGEGLQS